MRSNSIYNLTKKSDEHEFFNIYPEDYEKGRTKYIAVTGGVISGLGKGIIMASIGMLLKERGFKVSPIKFDGYLNVDAGTLNPFRHGEVFVIDDGTECDMDLGTYERFLDVKTTELNYMTSGRLFSKIIEKERKGGYLGRDVQFIPHVTGEIKYRLRKLAIDSRADIVLVEVGGTVGDIENSYFMEALREFRNEEGKENVLFVNATYILEPNTLGEQKSKAAQISLRTLLSLGIQPDIVVCRAENKVSEKIKEKISVFSNVPLSNVFSSPDMKTIYEVPLFLEEQGVSDKVCSYFGIKGKKPDFSELENFVKKEKELEKTVVIGIAGKYTKLSDSYASIIESLKFAGIKNNVNVELKWIETSDLKEGADSEAKCCDGIIVPGGFGKRGVEGKIKVIKYARENDIPYLGICYGFQLAIVEFARNVLGLSGAHTTEIEPSTPHPVICLLPSQLQEKYVGASMRLGGQDVLYMKAKSKFDFYNDEKVRERFRHRYEINPDYVERLEKSGLIFSGKAANAPIMQIGELKDKTYFVGTQFHPEFTSRPFAPNPFFDRLVKFAKEKRSSKA